MDNNINKSTPFKDAWDKAGEKAMEITLGKFIGTMPRTEEIIRLLQCPNGCYQVFFFEKNSTNSRQLLPDSHGENNPQGYFQQKTEAFNAIRTFFQDMELGVYLESLDFCPKCDRIYYPTEEHWDICGDQCVRCWKLEEQGN